jgi:4-amino-4-deoxy-L-arabinose transferase-like glycosyltransferase
VDQKSPLLLRLRDPQVLGLLSIFLIALALRLVNIKWGLATDAHFASYHPDEAVNWLYAQNIEPSKLQFTPHFYNYGTFYMTIIRICSDMARVYYGHSETNDPLFWSYVSVGTMLARVLTAIMGAGTAVVVTLMSRRFLSKTGAIAAGAAIAFAPAHIVHSGFMTVDVPALFLLSLGMFCALSVLPRGDEEEVIQVGRWVLFSGLFIGLSAGTKYNGALGMLTLWTVLAISRPKNWLLECFKGLGASIVAFVISTPGCLLETGKFLADVKFEADHSRTGHGLEFVGTPNAFFYHFSNLDYGLSILVLLFGLVGLAQAAKAKQGWIYALLAFFVPYLMLIGTSEVKFMRYCFPLMIGLAAGYGSFVSSIRQVGLQRLVLIVSSVFALGMWFAVGACTGPDPREVVGQFLRDPRNGAGSSVGVVSDPWYYTPDLYPEAQYPRPFANQDYEAMDRTANPRVVQAKRGSQWDLGLITQVKPAFIVYSNFETTNFERMLRSGVQDYAPDVQRFTTFMKLLPQDYDLLQVEGSGQDSLWPVNDMMYVRPRLWVWKRKV